ncbi:MAG: hypothetical protein E7B88_04630 [Finegoldia magna]|nr:hypothetical protein [Finegoldia magna]
MENLKLERVVEDMLYDMCFNIKNISNLELRKKIEECILKLYENEDIIQINNVLLYLDDNYESDDYANLEEVYTLDMYLSHDIKDIKLRFFNYEQLLEIHKGLKMMLTLDYMLIQNITGAGWQ